MVGMSIDFRSSGVFFFWSLFSGATVHFFSCSQSFSPSRGPYIYQQFVFVFKTLVISETFLQMYSVLWGEEEFSITNPTTLSFSLSSGCAMTWAWMVFACVGTLMPRQFKGVTADIKPFNIALWFHVSLPNWNSKFIGASPAETSGSLEVPLHCSRFTDFA